MLVAATPVAVMLYLGFPDIAVEHAAQHGHKLLLRLASRLLFKGFSILVQTSTHNLRSGEGRAPQEFQGVLTESGRGISCVHDQF